MTAAQAHIALAAALGDPIEVVTDIPDGVQFSKQLRDSYLDRGIMKILHGFTTQVASQRADEAAGIIYGLFPTFTRNNTIQISGFVVDDEVMYSLPASFDTVEAKSPIMLLDMCYVYGGGGNPTVRAQIPIVGANTYNSLVSRRFVTNNYADTVGAYYGVGSGLRVYNSLNEDVTNPPDHIEVNYLPQPKSLVDHDPTDEVDFEQMYMDNVIAYATLMGLNDRGDTDAQIMAQIAIPTLTKP